MITQYLFTEVRGKDKRYLLDQVNHTLESPLFPIPLDKIWVMVLNSACWVKRNSGADSESHSGYLAQPQPGWLQMLISEKRSESKSVMMEGTRKVAIATVPLYSNKSLPPLGSIGWIGWEKITEQNSFHFLETTCFQRIELPSRLTNTEVNPESVLS